MYVLFGPSKEELELIQSLKNELKQIATEIARMRMENRKNNEETKKYLKYISEAIVLLNTKINDIQDSVNKLDNELNNRIDQTSEETKGIVKEIQENIETTTSALIKMYTQILKRFTLIISYIGGDLKKQLEEEDRKIKEILKTREE